jgi:hypothetical protein
VLGFGPTLAGVPDSAVEAAPDEDFVKGEGYASLVTKFFTFSDISIIYIQSFLFLS